MTPEDLEPLIDAEAFQSLSLSITVKNLMTSSVISGMTEKNLIAVNDNSIVMSLEPNSCVQDNHLMIEISREKPESGKVVPLLQATAKAVEVISEKDASLRVTIQLLQHSSQEWQNFLKIFNSRQDEIMKFFKAQKE